MGNYLKDSFVPFITIKGDDLENLNSDLEEIVKNANLRLPDGGLATLSYVLRYDGMGIVRTDFEEIKRCFEIAKNVERIIFQVTSPKNYLNLGKNIEIFLDRDQQIKCVLRVTDDDEAWVDTTYKRLSSRLNQYKNRNWVAHSNVVGLLIQLFGVLAGLLGCLLAANAMAPLFKFQHSFLVLFIGLLLMFSNLWAYILVLLGKIRIHIWPFISFKKKPIGILGQAIIAAIISLGMAWLLKAAWWLLSHAGSMMVK